MVRHTTAPTRPTRAIAIPHYDFDESDTLLDSSPQQSAESWRPVPPPMLASSLDARFTSISTQRPAARRALSPTAPTPAAAAVYGSQDDAPRVDALPSSPSTAANVRRLPPVMPGRVGVRAKIDVMLQRVAQLNDAPRELWIIFALKFLSSYAYFSLSLVLTLFLTEEFDMSDSAAGWAYGAYGVMSTFFGLICGWFIDYLGVRASLLVGAVVGALSRLVVSLTLSSNVAVLMLYTLLPFAESLGIPIMTIGIKRYTNATNRTFAFSLFYSMMNVAALCAGPLVDLSRRLFADGFDAHVNLFGIQFDLKLTSLRLVVLSSAVSTALMVIVVAIGVREVEVDESGNITEFSPNRDNPIEQTRAVLRQPAFWRLTLFTLLLVGVRMVFRHIDATMPKYLVRQFGDDAPFGLVYAINPFLIIILVPMVGLFTRSIDSFKMILYGSFVSAASPFCLSFNQTYFAVVMFMVTLSLGEAVYSPRVYEYTMQVSGRGAEGLYTSLSSAPLFSVKLLVGGMSGWLLTNFMPEEPPHHGATMWTIIGLTSMTSPVLMCILREYISPSNVDDLDQPQIAPADSNVSKDSFIEERPLVSPERSPSEKPGHTSGEFESGKEEDGETAERLSSS